MEKIEQVFVSSTYTDLIGERQAVIEMLLKADCLPAGMEFFPAADDEKFELIKQVIDRSDYYIVVIGGRYGSVDSDGVSYTEREYDYAVEAGVPVMGFVHANPDEIPVGRTDKSNEALERLLAFREKVQKRMCALYSSPADLAGQVAASLINIRKTRPAEGWVRAGDALTPELRERIGSLHQEVADLRVQLAHAASSPPEGTEDLAQGSDPHSVRVKVQTREEKHDDFGWTIPEHRSYVWEVEGTWDGLFGAIGPLLFDESAERPMQRALDEYCSGLVDQGAFAHPVELTNETITDISVPDAAFHEVKTQLFALGLIQRSERARGVKDRDTYWTLTPFGEKHLVSLRAIRRSGDHG